MYYFVDIFLLRNFKQNFRKFKQIKLCRWNSMFSLLFYSIGHQYRHFRFLVNSWIYSSRFYINWHMHMFYSKAELEQYRPGQVFSLNAQELLDLQPERRAPLASGQQLQQLYAEPQPEHKQNLQPFYYLDPQLSSQVQCTSRLFFFVKVTRAKGNHHRSVSKKSLFWKEVMGTWILYFIGFN